MWDRKTILHQLHPTTITENEHVIQGYTDSSCPSLWCSSCVFLPGVGHKQSAIQLCGSIRRFPWREAVNHPLCVAENPNSNAYGFLPSASWSPAPCPPPPKKNNAPPPPHFFAPFLLARFPKPKLEHTRIKREFTLVNFEFQRVRHQSRLKSSPPSLFLNIGSPREKPQVYGRSPSDFMIRRHFDVATAGEFCFSVCSAEFVNGI